MKNQIYLLITLVFFSITGCSQNKHNPTMDNMNKHSNTLKLSDAEWKKKLSPNQYYVLREKGTEKPFSGEFVMNKDKGTYRCAGCGEILFTDDMKFESHCGWPSFDREVAGGKIIQTEDNSMGMHRTELTCAKCGGHLGHIFDDGPTETGKRYCINSLSLQFEPKKDIDSLHNNEMITLGGGCFWCMEAVFEDLKGVTKVESGYSGGKLPNPTYKEVCSGNTGHAEVVQISYNPSIISTEKLLEVFFTLHDPTTINRQGADMGTQYRSAIFYQNENQKVVATNVIKLLNQHKAYDNPIITEVMPFTHFYKAENYHQEYYELNKELPYCKSVIQPKIDKLHEIFKDKIK